MHAIQPGVLEGVYIGYVTARFAEEMFPEFQAALSRSTTTHWIINTLEMATTPPSASAQEPPTPPPPDSTG